MFCKIIFHHNYNSSQFPEIATIWHNLPRSYFFFFFFLRWLHQWLNDWIMKKRAPPSLVGRSGPVLCYLEHWDVFFWLSLPWDCQLQLHTLLRCQDNVYSITRWYLQCGWELELLFNLHSVSLSSQCWSLFIYPELQLVPGSNKDFIWK